MLAALAPLLVAPFAGCGGGTYERDPAEVRKSVDLLKDSLREVRGTLTHEGLTSIFVARVDEKKVYFIVETLDARPLTPLVRGVNQYYLDDGRLRVYESKTVVRDSTGPVGEPKTIDLELFFSEKGEVSQQRKAVNGSPQTPEQREIDEVKSRFAALHTEVRRQGSL